MIVYSVDIKNARLQDVIDAIDGAASPGYMVIATAGMALALATIPLSTPSFDAPANGMMDLADAPRIDIDTAASGTAAAAAIYDGDGNLKVSGLTVGVQGSGKDIILSQLNIAQHQRLEVQSGRIRHGRTSSPARCTIRQAARSRLASGAYTAPDNASIGAIKLQTDKFTFTVANMVDANIEYVNTVQVNGNGAGTPWGP